MCPVPSGELSSTIRISRRASWARTCGTRCEMFPTSLYVGTTTRARSPMRVAHAAGEGGHKPEEQHDKRHDGDQFAALIELGAKRELDDLCPGGHRDRYERVVAAQHRSRSAVD